MAIRTLKNSNIRIVELGKGTVGISQVLVKGSTLSSGIAFSNSLEYGVMSDNGVIIEMANTNGVLACFKALFCLLETWQTDDTIKKQLQLVQDEITQHIDFKKDNVVIENVPVSNIKQVVISTSSTFLLTPYWTYELIKKKKIDTYFYNEIKDNDYNIVRYELITPEQLKEDTKYRLWRSLEVVTKNLGNIVSKNDFENLEEESFIDCHNLWENREDQDLISIAKEINDESIIKIVEIPKDIEYEIGLKECELGEIIAEKRRIWS